MLIRGYYYYILLLSVKLLWGPQEERSKFTMVNWRPSVAINKKALLKTGRKKAS